MKLLQPALQPAMSSCYDGLSRLMYGTGHHMACSRQCSDALHDAQSLPKIPLEASTMSTISVGHARWKLVPSKLEDTQENHVENYGDYWVSSLMFLEATLLLLTVVSSKF
jgi:hypothetical protein